MFDALAHREPIVVYLSLSISETTPEDGRRFAGFELISHREFGNFTISEIVCKTLYMMNSKEKAAYIIKELDRLYPHPLLPLDFTNPYTLLIAVLLAARNTDVGVNKVTRFLFAKADNPFDMIKMSEDEIREMINTIFMKARKAKAVHDLSHILVDRFNGEVPADMGELEKLPGVGHKTASVVMAVAFDVPAFPVDTHIQRMMTRWGLTNGKSVEQTEEDAKKIFPRDKWNKLYLQITLYGREYSPARYPSLSRDYITAKIADQEVLKDYKP